MCGEARDSEETDKETGRERVRKYIYDKERVRAREMHIVR